MKKREKKPLPLELGYLVQKTIKAFPLSSFKGVLEHSCTLWTVNSYVINGTSMIDHDGSS